MRLINTYAEFIRAFLPRLIKSLIENKISLFLRSPVYQVSHFNLDTWYLEIFAAQIKCVIDICKLEYIILNVYNLFFIIIR